MSTFIKEGLARPVTDRRQLRDYLLSGARPREQWGIGAESEKIVIDARTGEAAPYARIEALLQRLECKYDWRGVHEKGHLIGLVGPDSSVTLEPGGQMELSGQLCPDIHCCQGDFSAYTAQLLEETESLGLVLLGMGIQPFSPLDEIDWVPKSRYDVMGPYMRRTGDMGQRMMKQTAGLQVNVDFADERDCLDKLRLAQVLSPLFYALFANSPLLDGRRCDFLTVRGEIWRRTDPDRAGFIESLMAEDATLEDYVDYALDVPMYFIVRDERYVNLTAERFTFRRYLEQGYGDERATLADWDLHLSTIFTEVRLRPQIELRSADSLPPQLTLGVAALIKGLFYDDESRRRAWEIFARQNRQEREELYRTSWRRALKTPFEDRTLREVALEVLALSAAGLTRQRVQNARGLDETIYLEGIWEIAESGVTLAERLLEGWRGGREEKLRALISHCGFRLHF